MNLTTERLLLRDFVEDDWPAVLAYQSDPRYLRFYPWTERTAEDVHAFVQKLVDQQRQQPRHRFQFAIVLPAERGHLIGNCGLRQDSPDARQADIGYELDPAYWGHGYATEAAQAMLRFGFEDRGVHRIWAHCIAENGASARVLEKIGMKLEGRQREHQWFKGRWWDRLLYAILEQEWRDQAGLVAEAFGDAEALDCDPARATCD
jgi:ribosomal-protein-alanine N-acetyltransferase